jgi:hypothetical protein
MDYALSISVVANASSRFPSTRWNRRQGAIFHCSAGVKIMSKEHKNKRDEKKKAVLSPKEKKAAKLAKKTVAKNVLGN